MLGIEIDDGDHPPMLADEYGPAVTFACEGALQAIRFCPRPVKYAHLLPDFGPGVWGFICATHARSCKAKHPDHLVEVER